MNISEAFEQVDKNGDLTYDEAVLIAKAYIRQAEARYQRTMRFRDKKKEEFAAQLYHRPVGRGQAEVPWPECLRRGKVQADELPWVEDQVGASKTEYGISVAYSSLATAIAAGTPLP